MTENANDRYERLADEFHRETGMMAPGKDDPTGHHSYQERAAAWLRWIANRHAAPTRAALAAGEAS